MKTKSKDKIWLVGYSTSSFPGSKIPTKGGALRLFFHHTGLKETVSESAHAVERALRPFYVAAGVDMQPARQVVVKVTNLFLSWKTLLKSNKQDAQSQQLQRKKFQVDLQKTFDVCDKKKLPKAKYDDRKFYEQMLENRVGYMKPDKKIEKENQKKDKELERKQKQKLKEGEEKERVCIKVEWESDSDDGVPEVKHQTDSDFDEDFKPPVNRKPKRINVLDEDLTGTLDRMQASSRDAFFAVTTIAAKLGFNIEDINCSRSYIQKQRISSRKAFTENVKSSLKVNGKVTVHFDGKLVRDVQTAEKLEGLPVLVTGVDLEQLLGVPMLEHSNAECESQAIFQLLSRWHLEESVGSVACDSPTLNTGIHGGVCVRLERLLARRLLWLICRHHVAEVSLKGAVETYIGPSQSPKIPLFTRLNDAWKKIDQSKYRTIASARRLRRLPVDADDIIQFCLQQLNETHPRADYFQFAQTTLILLGGVPPRKITFLSPAPDHRARFMSKAINILYTWMFQSQLGISSEEEKLLFELCVFIACVYVPYWFTTRLAAAALRRDLEFLKLLVRNRGRGPMWEAALLKFSNHLWYLFEENVLLCLFDSELSSDKKLKVVQALEVEAP